MANEATIAVKDPLDEENWFSLIDVLKTRNLKLQSCRRLFSYDRHFAESRNGTDE